MSLTTKRCRLCGETKDQSKFRRDARNTDGREHRCLACHQAAQRKRYAEDPSYRERNRRYNLKKLYGLTPAQVDAIKAAQSGLCAICQEPLQGGRREAVDHCHNTGRVRGVLCKDCNTGIGHMRDRPELLLRAAVYLSPT